MSNERAELERLERERRLTRGEADRSRQQLLVWWSVSLLSTAALAGVIATIELETGWIPQSVLIFVLLGMFFFTPLVWLWTISETLRSGSKLRAGRARERSLVREQRSLISTSEQKGSLSLGGRDDASGGLSSAPDLRGRVEVVDQD